MTVKADGHILIMRFSAMGDVAMVAPLVENLRREYPELKISILTRPFFQPFFKHIPNLDFVPVDLKGRHKGLMGLVRLYKDILPLKVDYVADIHDVLRTKVLCALLRISRKKIAVIDKGRMEKSNLTRKFRKIHKQLTPTVERYQKTIAHLGFSKLKTPKGLQPHKGPVPEFIDFKKEGSWIGYAPFAQHKGKIYPPVLSDQLINMLSQRYSKIFIFGGGAYEKEFSEYMASCYENVISVIGVMNLSQEIDLISNMDAMITMDSSSMHIASLTGTPAVSIWGATHPMAGFYGLGQDPAWAVQLDLECRPCSIYGNKKCLFKNYKCLTNIKPEDIIEKLELALKSSENTPSA